MNTSTERSIEAHMRRPDYTREQREAIAIRQATRQVLVSEHNNRLETTDPPGHPGGKRVPGCPYCYPPGPRQDHRP